LWFIQKEGEDSKIQKKERIKKKMVKIKFGLLLNGDCFFFRGDMYKKINESFGVLIGKNIRVEFGFSTTVEIE
jgi:hypothetical protein